MVPACCQPFEEVMSLDASCLDTGMPGLCAFPTEGKVGYQEQELWIYFSESQRSEARQG